jgi:hypothetical protein
MYAILPVCEIQLYVLTESPYFPALLHYNRAQVLSKTRVVNFENGMM